MLTLYLVACGIVGWIFATFGPIIIIIIILTIVGNCVDSYQKGKEEYERKQREKELVELEKERNELLKQQIEELKKS